ncbi:MAG: hypothetical protein ACPGYV_13405, partial [Phycisphaeraceae bacterium]
MRCALKYPPVRINGEQARLVASGFAQACVDSHYAIYACAILPNHTHLVLARHESPIEQIASHLKARATQRLNHAEMNPL